MAMLPYLTKYVNAFGLRYFYLTHWVIMLNKLILVMISSILPSNLKKIITLHKLTTLETFTKREYRIIDFKQ